MRTSNILGCFGTTAGILATYSDSILSAELWRTGFSPIKGHLDYPNTIDSSHVTAIIEGRVNEYLSFAFRLAYPSHNCVRVMFERNLKALTLACLLHAYNDCKVVWLEVFFTDPTETRK